MDTPLSENKPEVLGKHREVQVIFASEVNHDEESINQKSYPEGHPIIAFIASKLEYLIDRYRVHCHRKSDDAQATALHMLM
jgi:hypothetical protein